jgi:hypothetical protein
MPNDEGGTSPQAGVTFLSNHEGRWCREAKGPSSIDQAPIVAARWGHRDRRAVLDGRAPLPPLRRSSGMRYGTLQPSHHNSQQCASASPGARGSRQQARSSDATSTHDDWQSARNVCGVKPDARGSDACCVCRRPGGRRFKDNTASTQAPPWRPSHEDRRPRRPLACHGVFATPNPFGANIGLLMNLVRHSPSAM